MEQDKILYKKFLEGDNEAFNELIKKHKSKKIILKRQSVQMKR